MPLHMRATPPTSHKAAAARIAAAAASGMQRVLNSFAGDQSGSYVIMCAVLMPVFIGMSALGTEVGMWLYTRQTVQSAADSAAISAAIAYYYGSDTTTAADAVAASYGFVSSGGKSGGGSGGAGPGGGSSSGATITVSRPPATGNYTTTAGAVEVDIQQPQSALFSKLFGIVPFEIKARAVALANIGGTGCTLSLDPTASGATTVKGSAQVTLNGCDMYDDSNSATALSVNGSATVSARSVDVVGGVSGTSNITVSQDIATDQSYWPDPYANTQIPNFSGCDAHNFSAKSAVTLNPGVYCGGMSLNAGAVVTLNPGIYYLDRGSLQVNGGASLTGTNVTLVFTSSNGQNYSTATINGGATVNLTAPTSGPTQGIVLYGDQNMPTGTSFKFNGGASQYFGGAIYIPKGAIDFAGGANTSTGCTQLIGDTLTFTGNSNLSINCSGSNVKPIGTSLAKLVE